MLELRSTSLICSKRGRHENGAQGLKSRAHKYPRPIPWMHQDPLLPGPDAISYNSAIHACGTGLGGTVGFVSAGGQISCQISCHEVQTPNTAEYRSFFGKDLWWKLLATDHLCMTEIRDIHDGCAPALAGAAAKNMLGECSRKCKRTGTIWWRTWLVGGLEHFVFFRILGIIIPTD